jgi:hypothetical protein
MITIKNPENGAKIEKFRWNGSPPITLPVGDVDTYEDAIGRELLDRYGFLQEITVQGKYVCKKGDYASDTKVAVINHEKKHKEELVEDKPEVAQAQPVKVSDRDESLLEGPGLEVDETPRPKNAGRFGG